MNEFSPTGSFNAHTVEPSQGGSKHPVGMFPFRIASTDVVQQKDNENNYMFKVTFESPAGTIDKHYNLKHENAQTVEIAQKQLSALCHATGIFQLNWANKGRELVNGRGTMEIAFQKGQEPGSEKGGPNGGYVEVKKVFDQAGNEPGKAPSNQQQPQQGQQNNAGNQNWGNQSGNQPQGQAPQQQQPQQQPPQNNNWGQQAPTQQPQQNQQPQGGQNAGWSQQGGGQQNPPPAPWGK